MSKLDRISVNPAVMTGRPCIRGLRVTAGNILNLFAAGRSREEILAAYPYLESDDLDACLEYAALRVNEEKWISSRRECPCGHEPWPRLGHRTAK